LEGQFWRRLGVLESEARPKNGLQRSLCFQRKSGDPTKKLTATDSGAGSGRFELFFR
jgi:hypothetical protein